jgi:hypothetical protein
VVVCVEAQRPRVDMGIFERNMKVLSDYLKLTKQ